MPANLTPECKAGGGIPQGARELIPIAFLRAIRQPLHAVTGEAAAFGTRMISGRGNDREQE